MPWYSTVHTPVMQIEIKHFLANLQGGKPKKDRNTEFYKKRQVETGRFIVGLSSCKVQNVVMATTPKQNPLFYGC